MTDETRRRLLVLAEHLEQAATEAKRRNEPLAALALLEGAVMARAALEGGLTVKQQAAILKGVEHSTETRKALSKRFSKRRDPNMEAAREAGIPSLRALATKLGCSASFLSQVAAGDRPMPADKAEAFKKLTGKAWQ